MPVFNWIQTGFADGPNFVSDAPDEIVQAIATALPLQHSALPLCHFGSVRISTGRAQFACSFIRYGASTDVSTDYVHAVVSASGETEPTLSAVEALFQARYGKSPETRLREWVAELSQRPVAEATLSVTDLFVSNEELDRALGGGKSARGSKAPRRSSSSTLPWLVATVAIGFAAFIVGRMPNGLGTPAVGAPPPSLELAERIERLEGDRGAAGMSLRAQLEYERREHTRALQKKDEELRDLVAELESASESTEVSGEAEKATEKAAVEPPQSAPTKQPPSVSAPPPARETPVRVEPSSRLASQAVVLADLLWIRGGPGTEYTRVWSVDGGATVDLAGGYQAGWIEISSPEPGWVAAEFLEFLGDPPSGVDVPVTSVPSLNPRAIPEPTSTSTSSSTPTLDSASASQGSEAAGSDAVWNAPAE